MDDLQTIATTTTTVVTTVGAAGFALYKLLQKEIKKRTEEVQKTTIESLSFELQKLNGFVDALLEAMPYPAWVKLLSYEDGKAVLRMKYVNQAYEETFGISRYRYIGKTDWEVHDKSVADNFYAHDMAVIGRDEAITFQEPFRFKDDNQPTMCTYQKLPINRDKYKGVIGFMFPDEFLKLMTEQGKLPPELPEANRIETTE